MKKIKFDLNKSHQIVSIASKIIFLFFFLLAVYAFVLGKDSPNRMILSNVPKTEGKWLLDGEPIDTATKDKETVLFRKGQRVTLAGTIPENVGDGYAAMVHALYSVNEVFVDDKLIYSYGSEKALPFGSMVGNVRVLVPLTADMAGKHMSIVITPYHSVNADITIPLFAHEADLKAYVFSKNIVQLGVEVFMVVIILMCLGLLLFQKKTGNTEDFELVVNFIGFIFFVMLWIFCSSDIPQFFTDRAEAVSFVSFMSLAFMCIPFTGMCKNILNNGIRMLEIIWQVGWIIPLLNMLLFVLNICDPLSILALTHVFIAVSCILCVYFSIRNLRTNVGSRQLLLGMTIVAVSAISGVVLFYIYPSENYASTAFGVGFTFFFFFMMWVIFMRQAKALEEKKFIETYKSMAYSDSMTNLENRTSFDMKFSSMTEGTMNGKMITLFIFDFNNLKIVNDEFGLGVGDSVIIGLAECIKQIFGNIGICYRLGGDEFGVLLESKAGQELGYAKDFELCVEKYNEVHEHKLSVAYGFETRQWSEDSNFFRDLLRDAGQNMYEMKVKMEETQL